MTSRTVYDVLCATASRYPALPALLQPSGGGRYRTYTWQDYRAIVEQIAAGLQALGVAPGDVVALDSETRAEFYLADIGIMASGAVSAALYGSYPPADRAATLRASGARVVFVENPQTLARLRAAGADALPATWILLTGEAENALPLEELRRRGREFLAGRAFASPARPESHAILYLTSGATGEPKMVLVSHAALIANIDMGPEVLNLTPEDAMLAFLPSAHITQRVVVELLPLGAGVPVWFSEGLMRLPDEIRSVQPTIFVAPPRLYERIHTTVRTELRKRPLPLRRFADWGLSLGLEQARARLQGRRLPLHKRAVLALADRLVLARLRQRFGGRVRVCGSGSAPLGKELTEFYLAVGLPIVEGYGLTEGGVVVLNPLARPRPGSIGKPLPGVEVRLADDGELLVRSATVFSGYCGDPAATAQVLRDGWLRTGDLAEIDSDGYVYITGRKKELIVSSSGRKIYPSRLEALFHLEPIVSHVVPVGDQLPYMAALFTINPKVAAQLRGMDAWRGRPDSELPDAPPVRAELERAVARVNRKLAPFEQIRRYRVLNRDLSIEAGELTATMKVRRARALENFRSVVEELYAGREAHAS